jgi:preprotein translocase subunit SecG
MQTVLIILDIIVSLMLVLVVLFQSGKEAGLSGALSGNTDTYMSKNKRAGLDKMLATSTKWIALAWVIITLALVLVVAAA